MSSLVWLTERSVQLRGSRLALWVLKAMGWTLVWEGLPARQGVLIAYPHTSNWDFVIGVLAKWAIGIPAKFWGKDSLFRIPLLGRWFRWIGGIPVDRSGARGIASAMTERFQAAREADEFLWLALAPEGTRSLVDHWKSGFYPVAFEAGVPIGLILFDYRRKRVGFDRFVMLSGDRHADMAVLAEYYREHAHGARPELASPVRLK
ncbi:1-acyl-sn-glycerol-3-phosphate acyltransferase [Ideonella alba]|uniref:1-acyl-sn-glycerol-3-phosphate acyltransferase n=1 Tax=Ideonella alba TaxID=2824118 RepID=UPI001FFC8407|nr:1-acyl-sn-glycerol-3-phosphate acyltransferase [Ideonella alba]